ncbi:hypothetical protein G7067_00310 [Leucobacter insecticola]|uniref:Right-handed parallel beta-helix repeat-containing protein n=1 Tax=Leucobacter insecticola TaxID=2714934 RepID=A0A6G8FFV1_9MICO|nr:hypothetical protein [Leucobacter insecticola]QIM15207.1 hypothetical protein G7067_00310 [Leucobacter insecticola]
MRSAWRHYRGRLIAAATVACALVAGSLVMVSAAQAVSYTFVVDSLDGTANARSINANGGVCKAVSGGCTLRAAIETSNALNLPKGQVTITVADWLNGNINPTNSASARMENSVISSFDYGAHFAVTAPVKIDLKNQVSIVSSVDTITAIFYVNGSDVELRNMTQILAGRSSFVAGPKSNGFTIDGGSTVTNKNYYPEAFLVIREGAKNTSVRNYQLQGFYPSGNSALFYVNNMTNNSSIATENLVVDNVDITYTSGGQCNAWDGSGCRTHILRFYPQNQNTELKGFTFKDSFVSNLTNQDAFPFSSNGTYSGSVRASDINISGNDFINVQGNGGAWYQAFISLPFGPINGTNVIENNQIVRAAGGQPYAVTWGGDTLSGQPAGGGTLRISNNYFNGYNANSIFLSNTGDVTVEKNTFGARSVSQGRPAIAEESYAGSGTMLANSANANGRVRTWYPSADAKVLTEDAPEGAAQVDSPLAEDIPVCVATVPVQAPTEGPFPADTVDLDVYWTQDRTAEIYLGRASEITGKSGTLILNLPVGEQSFPSTVVGQSDKATIVDAQTGAAKGYIRVQTIASESGQSSQYSRIVGISGSCRPEITINQAQDQNDPTLARDLHYTVTSSVPLRPESVLPAVDISAAAVAETIDADRLNPRNISAEPVPGSANREFTVIARVDDSATVQLGIAAEKVRSTGGLTNRDPAASVDPSVTFHNPVRLSPKSFTLVAGEPSGKDYRFKITAGAPDPTADLNFEATGDEATVTNKVSLSTNSPVVKAGETQSNKVRVTAEASEVEANTPAVFAHTVSSTDTNYDGLVVDSLLVRLFSVDPSISITKRAFVSVSDSSSPESIMATGTEALKGERLTDAQPVCFVYTVTNTSRDAWETILSDVTVTDSDTRLGEGGIIGVVPTLPVGESVMLSACSVLIPVDTTVEGP